ncbi:Glycerate_kinase [Hexamita inflata]|uniref:Glycerate kinase n=1 Tax=Hexamita inflata TaxID=28002 RepID=A0AA86NU74_9EUKA|nr:Glycerate kinase [Hexamita inflata]
MNQVKDVEFIQIKLADGGENTLEALCTKFTECDTFDPLFRPLKHIYGITDQNQIVIEMSRSVGLQLLTKSERNPLYTSSFGFGYALNQLLDKSNEFILTVGGSSTNDLGLGFLQALGARFLTADNKLIQNITPSVYKQISSIDLSPVYSKIQNKTFKVLSDVQNPVLGPTGCARIFSPQKGATPQIVDFLEQFGSFVLNQFKFRELSSDGAAGGIVYVLRNVLGAEVISGAEFVLSAQNFVQMTKQANLLLTGEGKFDEQTGFGKAVQVVCKQFQGKKVGIFGQIEGKWEGLLDAAFSCQRGICTLDDAVKNSAANVAEVAKGVINLMRK